MRGSVCGNPLDPSAAKQGGLSLREAIQARLPLRAPVTAAKDLTVAALEPIPYSCKSTSPN